MKTINLKRIMLIAIFFIAIVGTSFAQHGGNMGENKKCALDLTEDQQAKVKDIKAKNQKVMLDLRNKLSEKEARLQTVSTGDKVDINAVYKAIDEIGAIEITIAKKRAETHQSIRKILTDEQRVSFDLHYGKNRRFNNHKQMKGHSGYKYKQMKGHPGSKRGK